MNSPCCFSLFTNVVGGGVAILQCFALLKGPTMICVKAIFLLIIPYPLCHVAITFLDVVL
jgi:hypothetical protein